MSLFRIRRRVVVNYPVGSNGFPSLFDFLDGIGLVMIYGCGCLVGQLAADRRGARRSQSMQQAPSWRPC